MEYLKFNFCHPVRGHAFLIHLSNTLLKSLTLCIHSDRDNSIVVPVDECLAGKWKVVLEWHHDNQSFTHQKEFEML